MFHNYTISTSWVHGTMSELSPRQAMKFLHRNPPSIPENEVRRIAANVFGLEGEFTPLISERDQNFQIQARDGQYVLKIANVAEDPNVVDLQVQGLLHIEKVDPDVPVWMVRPMDRVFDASVADDRFVAAAISAFAVLALALGLVGVYGVTSYTVSRRRSEFGIRVALGLALGVGAAWLSSQLLSSLLFGITARDPWAFLAAPTLLGVAGAAAAYLPAARASRVDPVEVLRGD